MCLFDVQCFTYTLREDETVEVIESHDKNCGRYKAPVFFKRCRLQKVMISL